MESIRKLFVQDDTAQNQLNQEEYAYIQPYVKVVTCTGEAVTLPSVSLNQLNQEGWRQLCLIKGNHLLPRVQLGTKSGLHVGNSEEGELGNRWKFRQRA
jgi:hypothetical protein